MLTEVCKLYLCPLAWLWRGKEPWLSTPFPHYSSRACNKKLERKAKQASTCLPLLKGGRPAGALKLPRLSMAVASYIIAYTQNQRFQWIQTISEHLSPHISLRSLWWICKLRQRIHTQVCFLHSSTISWNLYIVEWNGMAWNRMEWDGIY